MFELRKLKLQYDVFNMSRDVQKAVREYLDHEGVINRNSLISNTRKWRNNVLACSLDSRVSGLWVPETTCCTAQQ